VTAVNEAAAGIAEDLAARGDDAVLDQGVAMAQRAEAHLRHGYLQLVHEGVVQLDHVDGLQRIIDARHLVGTLRRQVVGHDARHDLVVPAREGVLVADVQCALVKRSPCFASLSIFGVLILFAP